jgi:hypothetical protein
MAGFDLTTEVLETRFERNRSFSGQILVAIAEKETGPVKNVPESQEACEGSCLGHTNRVEIISCQLCTCELPYCIDTSCRNADETIGWPQWVIIAKLQITPGGLPLGVQAKAPQVELHTLAYTQE